MSLEYKSTIPCGCIKKIYTVSAYRAMWSDCDPSGRGYCNVEERTEYEYCLQHKTALQDLAKRKARLIKFIDNINNEEEILRKRIANTFSN